MKSQCHQLICRWIRSMTGGLLSLIALAQMANGQALATSQTKERELTFTVSVTNDRGLVIKGLKPEHFKISNDKKPQEITNFSDGNEPISIGFLVDTSGSMMMPTKNENRLRFAVGGIRGFLQTGNEANEYAILSFSSDTRLVLDWTRDRQTAAESLTRLAAQPANGQTAFYDACRQAMDLMRRGSHRIRVLILLSDGQDTVSKDTRFGKLKQAIRADDVTFYSISITPPAASVMLDMAGQDALSDLAKLTGGAAFFPIDSFAVNGTFELVGQMLRNRYVVGFKTSQPAADKWHEVKIEIKLPPGAPSELKYPVLKYRAGYFNRAPRD